MYQTSIIFRKIINSLTWSLISSIYRLFINFAIIVIISRIIDPRDFGIINYSIVLFNSVFLILSDSIGQSYLIGKIENNKIKLFNTNLFFFILIGTSIYIFVGILNYLYLPHLWFTYVQLILFASFILRLPSIIFEYDLIKTKKFKILSIIDVVSLSIYFVTAVTLAFLGYKYFCIVFATTALYVSKSFIILTINYKKLGQICTFSKLNIKTIKVSFKFIKTNLATFMFDNTEKIILPIITSLPFLGYYTRANAINNIPLTIITKPIDNVIYSFFTDNSKSKTKFDSYFENLIIFCNFIFLPMTIFVMFYSFEIVNLILGDGWDETAIILKYLSPMIFFLYMTKCFEPIYKSSNFLNFRTRILSFFIFLKIILLGLFVDRENVSLFVVLICSINFIYLLTLIIYFLSKINFKLLQFLSFFKQNMFFLIIFTFINFFISDISFIYIILLNIFYYLCAVILFKFLLSKKTKDIISDYIKF